MRLGAGIGATALTMVVAGCGVVTDSSGVTASAGDDSSGSVPEVSAADVEALDAYADELGLVMVRTRGPEAATYARQVDGPGPDVETLVAESDDGTPEVVLRLRQERAECGWLGGSCQSYEVSACYQWIFRDSIDDHEPERLEQCPEVPVIALGPAPVEPRLPDGLVERLEGSLAPGAKKAVVLAEVRAAYRAAVRDALSAPDVEPEHLIGIDDALGPYSVAVVDGEVGVAVGRGTECVMVRVSGRDVMVWSPDRMSLMPGEVGCFAAGQLE